MEQSLWYNKRPDQSHKSFPDEISLIQDRGWVRKLQHGKSKRLAPIRLVFGYIEISDLTIGYSLHAENQPEDTTDEIHVSIKEEA
jgi:hypothetical protein